LQCLYKISLNIPAPWSILLGVLNIPAPWSILLGVLLNQRSEIQLTALKESVFAFLRLQ